MLIQKHHPQNTATLKLPTRDTATSASVCSPFNSQRSFILWEAYIFVFWPSLFWLMPSLITQGGITSQPVRLLTLWHSQSSLSCAQAQPPPLLLIGWNDCIFTFFCYPFTELGVSMKSPLFSFFFSAHTELTASSPKGDIHWIWQKVRWISINDYTFNDSSEKVVCWYLQSISTQVWIFCAHNLQIKWENRIC